MIQYNKWFLGKDRQVRYIPLILIAGFVAAYADSRHSVNDLIVMTINTHPSIKMQEQVIRGANAQVQGTMWNYFPTPSISANQGVNKGKLWTGTIAIEQPLWTGGKISSAYDMAVANKHNSEFGLEDSGYTLAETLLNTIKTYLKAKGDLEALAEGKMQLEILEGMVSRRVAAGVSSKSDMELLKARIYQMQTDINYAETRRATSLAQIELLTNQKFNGDLTIDERVPFSFDSVDNIIKSMINTHPTLKKFDAQLEYAEAEKSKAKSVFWPNISIKAERGVGSSSLYYDSPTDETMVYVAVQLSPGAGLSAFSGVETAEAKIMQVRQEKLSKQQDLINKVMYAYNDYISSTNRIESQSGSIGSSQKVFASYTRLFLAGKRQWLDLVNASRELTQNEMAFADTKSTLLVSAYQLALLSGKENLLGMLGNNKLAKLKKPAKPIEPVQPSIPADKNQKVTFDTIFSRKDENLSKTPIAASIPNGSKVDKAPSPVARREEKVMPVPVHLATIINVEKPKVTVENKKVDIIPTTPTPNAKIATAKIPVVAANKEGKPKIAAVSLREEKPKVEAAASKAEKAKTTTVASKTVIAKKAENKDKNETKGWSFAGLFSKKPETKAAAAPKTEKAKTPLAAAKTTVVKKVEVKAVAVKKVENTKVATVSSKKVESKDKNETKGWSFASLFSKKPETKAAPAVVAKTPIKTEVKVVAAKAPAVKTAVVEKTPAAKKEEAKATMAAVAKTPIKAEKPKVAAVAKKPKKIVIENMVVSGKSKAIAPMPEPQQPIGMTVKATKPIPGQEQYYVQFDAKLDENMKNELKKQNLEIIENVDHGLIGCYAKAADALKVAREVKKIICDEACIVRQ